MADARGEYWYLGPDVDAGKITVPELRSILLKHGVTYPSSAKKPVLVGLFNEQVAPQAANIQRTHARTKRTTRGIEDMSSSQASTTTDDAEDETLLALPAITPRRASRRTTRASTEEETGGRAAPTPVGRTPARMVPTKHDRGSDVELDEAPPARRNRKSAAAALREPPARADESPFTQENPFQSGSSPLGPESAARDRRRKTMGSEQQRERRRTDAFRRRTVQPNAEQQDEGIVVPTRRTFDVSVPRARQEEPVDEPDFGDAGEEFTGEEQLELVRERAKAGEVDVLPPRRRKQASKATGTLKAFGFTLVATTFAVLGGVYRQEKYAVGFCGIGKEATSLAGVDVPEWAGTMLPQCEPCPQHATCYQNLEVACDRDFIQKDHPFAMGGLIPLPPTCEPDSEKTRRITLVADRGVQMLRKRKAEYECGEPDAEGKPVEKPEVAEDELRREIASLKKKDMSQEEFDDLFSSAIGEMVSREEIVEKTDGTTGGRQLASGSLAELSLSCSIRRSLRAAIERYLWHLALTILGVGGAAYGRYSYNTSRKMEARAKYLASEVFDRLANQAAVNNQDYDSDLGISMAHLRDDILRNEFSSARRQKLWERVQKKVELNSNVRAAVREGRSGDVSRMWEWIGPVKLLEDGRSGGKRESGRRSLGPAFGSSPPSGSKEMKDNKTWDEGRPIY
ncbi:sister chromatid separation protein-like protein [Massariosphaeria phaeospora]|uniref:Sister chromatid separation protein-like protein n=1 Tax=Massariosphaeria phaeospora TaxID=100035 RepID=A0A7C8MGK2_9PLEO|nr:sister chromatid separation protein-like protein [Massariosphaeria phaeospora]